MLGTPPPGYSPSTVNRQYNNTLGRAGVQGLPGASAATASSGFSTSMPGLSSNPLLQQSNMAMILKLLKGGAK